MRISSGSHLHLSLQSANLSLAMQPEVFWLMQLCLLPCHGWQWELQLLLSGRC